MMAKSRRGQWSVLVVNSVTAGTVLVLVAVLALVVKPPAPPGIAAFAPQASKPITKAPPGQSAQFGDGAGACGSGQVCEGGKATPKPVTRQSALPLPSASAGASGPPRGVPSALQCYTWPDGSVTQTFDPQSPPCIATWDDTKGNGGATSPGVTGTEIRVALPINTTQATWPDLKPLVDFLNTRYQFYGRKLRIVTFPSQQADKQFSGTFNDPVAQRADAAQIPALHVFASTGFVDPIEYSWSLPVFRDVLTKHKIISLAGGETTPYGTEQDFVKHAPYEWTYYPTIDELLRNVATMTCRQLVGHLAIHAPDPALHKKVRKFAVVIPTDQWLGGPMPGLPSLISILRGCGVPTPKVVRYDYAAANRPALAANFRQLSDDGVTSVILFPQSGNQTSHPMGIAAQVNFHPEWIMIGDNKYLTDNSSYNDSQTVGAFGVGAWNKMPQLELEMWYQAYLAAGGDQSVLNSGALPDGRAFYAQMMLLAAGVQMAGPNLTPQSFASGLQSTTFPNPGAGSAPAYQGSVGFTPGDVTMLNDLNAFWMSSDMQGAQVTNSKNLNTAKASCYVGLGRRWSLDTWPTTDAFYQGGCR